MLGCVTHHQAECTPDRLWTIKYKYWYNGKFIHLEKLVYAKTALEAVRSFTRPAYLIESVTSE